MASNYRVQMVKHFLGHQWSNDYNVRQESLDDAQDAATIILTFERHLHLDVVTFDYIRVSHPDPATRIFRHLPVNVQGLANSSGLDLLPLFNTLRMDLETADTDPGRKYFRLPIAESFVTQGQFTAESLTAWNGVVSTYLEPSFAELHIVTHGDVEVIGASFFHDMQERQLRRRRRPKVV